MLLPAKWCFESKTLFYQKTFLPENLFIRKFFYRKPFTENLFTTKARRTRRENINVLKKRKFYCLLRVLCGFVVYPFFYHQGTENTKGKHKCFEEKKILLPSSCSLWFRGQSSSLFFTFKAIWP